MRRNAFLFSFVFVLSISNTFLAADTACKSSNIYDDKGEIAGFIDEEGMFHEMAPAAEYDRADSNSLLMASSSEGETAGQDLTRRTIDLMTTYDSSLSYSPGGSITVLADAYRYYLNDGSSWNSGAGTFSRSGSRLDYVEVVGDTVRFVLRNPTTWRRTDYDGGNHSAQGELVPLPPLKIEATIGSTAGKLTGQAEIISNDETWYGEPRFNYFSAPVGAVVPIEVTYALRAGKTFTADLFNSSFQYDCSGEVDFANPISIPLPVKLEILGSSRVLENSTVSYTATVEYDNGGQRNVTESATWEVEPASFASISTGTLITEALLGDEQILTISASYSEGGVTVSAEKTVTCLPEGSIYPENSWPMFQVDKEHSGYVPMSVEPEVFSLRWERLVGPGNSLNPVTAADGKVFVSLRVYHSSIASLFVLDARDGETLWLKDDFGRVSRVNPPSYAYGNVYIQTGKESSSGIPPYLHAYDAETGAQVFKSKFSAQWEEYYAPTIYKGKIYVNGGYYGGMYCFDAFDGSQQWFMGLPQYDEWTPAVDEDYAYAYVGEYSPGLYAVGRHSGELAYKISDNNFDWNGWSMRLAPVIGSQDNILTIQDGRLIYCDLINRTIKWEIGDKFNGQPTIAKGVIYAINNGGLDARDETTGDMLWSWSAPEGGLTGTMIVTDTHLFARTSNSTFAVELLSYEDVWSYPASGHLALGNEALYIAASDGKLTAISVPEYVPSEPVRLEIIGPSEVVENSEIQYTATVYYDDGRIRNRTNLTSWTAEPNDYAEIDEFGVLRTAELLLPSENFTLHACYIEGEKTVEDSMPITISIDGDVNDLMYRNITKALDLKFQILGELRTALGIEKATSRVLWDSFKGRYNTDWPLNNISISRANINQGTSKEKSAYNQILDSIVDLEKARGRLSGEAQQDGVKESDLSANVESWEKKSADINMDHVVDLHDLALLSRHWLEKVK